MEVIFLAFKDYFKFNKDETTFMFIGGKRRRLEKLQFLQQQHYGLQNKVKKH